MYMRKTLLALLLLWVLAGAIGIAGVLRWRSLAGTSQASVNVAVDQPAGAPVPDFVLTDQNGRSVALANLRGRVWIGAFIFTRCSDICPGMAATLASLQTAIPDKDVLLVSFSVDPEHDTPAILNAYAQKLGADGERWHLVTGAKADIERVSRGMLLGLSMSDKPQEVTHSDRFVLVGRDGVVRGYYSALDEREITRLKEDVAKLTGSNTPITP